MRVGGIIKKVKSTVKAPICLWLLSIMFSSLLSGGNIFPGFPNLLLCVILKNAKGSRELIERSAKHLVDAH